MQQRQSQQQGMLSDLKSATNWVVLICQTMATSVEIFLHDRFGQRFLDVHALLAIPVMCLFSLLFPHDDSRPMIHFIEAYVLVCFAIRLEIFVRRRQGKLVGHSKYSGRPILLRLFPRLDEVHVKQRLEPLLVFAVGVVVVPHSHLLGGYLMTAALGMAVSVSLGELDQHTKALDIRDAVISQSQVAERFRDMNHRR